METDFATNLQYILLFVTIIFIITFYTFPNLSSTKRRPPGPYSLIPFIGFLIHFVRGKNYPKELLKLKQKYGKIASVQMGSFKCIFLNDYNIIKSAWAQQSFCGRPAIPAFVCRSYNFKGGIIFNDGKDCIELRKFAIKTLKEFGMCDKNFMENLILEEVVELVQGMKWDCGTHRPISTRHRLNIASLNALWKITTGEKVPHNDPVVNNIAEILTRNMELNNGARAAIFMPWLAKLFPSFIGWSEYISDANTIYEFWLEYARKRIHSFHSNPIPNNFVHSFLEERLCCENGLALDCHEKESEIEKSLACLLQDLFIAGMETTATTLCWSFLLLAVHKREQESLYQEILRVIGRTELPSLKNRLEMPYTEATILEILRFSSLAPLGFLHSATQNVNIHGYEIDANTIIISNISAIHNDPEVWGDPENFRPERFILENGEVNTQHNSFLPFSYGRRSCLGEKLAKEELFLFITGVIQAFEIDTFNTIPSLIPNIGVSAVPKPHELIFRYRGENKGLNHF